MSNNRNIKVIAPGMCPHCNKEIVIAYQMTTPAVDWILKQEDIESAKETIRKKILEALGSKTISKEEKDELTTALEWVNKPETLFGPAEVDTLVEQIFGKK